MSDPLETMAFTGGPEAESPSFALPSPDETIEDDETRTRAYVESVETAVEEARLKAAAEADATSAKLARKIGEEEMPDTDATANSIPSTEMAAPETGADNVLQVDPREVNFVMQAAINQVNDLNTKVLVLTGRCKHYESYINALHAALDKANIPVPVLLRGEITKYVATMSVDKSE